MVKVVTHRAIGEATRINDANMRIKFAKRIKFGALSYKARKKKWSQPPGGG